MKSNQEAIKKHKISSERVFRLEKIGYVLEEPSRQANQNFIFYIF